MSFTPTYDALPVETRLEIERRLYERIFGQPYTERSIPEDASPRQQEYLVSCIRNAIYLGNDGRVIPAHQVDATREFSAIRLQRPGAEHRASLVSPVEARQQAAAGAREHMRRLAAEGKLPHRLEDYLVEAELLIGQDASGAPSWATTWVLADQILLPEGVQIEGLRINPEFQHALFETVKDPIVPERPARVQGIECRVLMARETGIPRRQVCEKHLKPLGYKHRGDRGSQGYVVFEKTRADGTTLTCKFDFGTWRASVIALFGYARAGVVVRLPLQYWREERPVDIVTRAMFARTIENVAFVVKELEDFLSAPPA